ISGSTSAPAVLAYRKRAFRVRPEAGRTVIQPVRSREMPRRRSNAPGPDTGGKSRANRIFSAWQGFRVVHRVRPGEYGGASLGRFWSRGSAGCDQGRVRAARLGAAPDRTGRGLGSHV